jgi:hypothetical protein
LTSENAAWRSIVSAGLFGAAWWASFFKRPIKFRSSTELLKRVWEHLCNSGQKNKPEEKSKNKKMDARTETETETKRVKKARKPKATALAKAPPAAEAIPEAAPAAEKKRKRAPRGKKGLAEASAETATKIAAKVAPKIKGAAKKPMSHSERRKHIKYPQTGWNLFCEEQRAEIRKADPTIPFGRIPQEMSPRWKALTDEQRDVYCNRYRENKKIYDAALAALDPAVRARMPKRRRNSNLPKGRRSAFIFFSKEARTGLKAERPEVSFADMGRILGLRWQEMKGTDSTTKYFAMAEVDRARYSAELKAMQPA